MENNFDFESINQEELASSVVKSLIETDCKIAAAESCTAGMFSGALTTVSGSSGIFDMGLTCYSNESKTELLGIPEKTIREFGAVSGTVAAMMADSVRRRADAYIGVGITGIAGPDGGTEEKPVGTVYVALSIPGEIWVERLELTGEDETRDSIRSKTVLTALYMVNRYLLGDAAEEFKAVEDGEPLYDEEKKHKGFMGRLIRSIIPWKGDSALEIVRKCVLMVAVVVFVVSAAFILDYFKENIEADQILRNAEDLLNAPPTQAQLDNLPEGWDPRFAALYAENPDIRGWIAIKNTSVNYPVVQAKDNDYYLYRNFKRQKNDLGVPFLDYRSTIAKDRLSDNTTIYSHNIRNGMFFGQLNKYKDLKYYKEHPIVTFDTVYKRMEWAVIGVYITTADPKDGPVFEYHNFVNRQNDTHFEWYINQIKLRSLITTNVEVTPGDSLLTLSTCTYDMGNSINSRLVVVARLIREGESIDPSSAYLNPKPLYPDYWYKKFNRQKPAEYEAVDVNFRGSADPTEVGTEINPNDPASTDPDWHNGTSSQNGGNAETSTPNGSKSSSGVVRSGTNVSTSSNQSKSSSAGNSKSSETSKSSGPSSNSTNPTSSTSSNQNSSSRSDTSSEAPPSSLPPQEDDNHDTEE